VVDVAAITARFEALKTVLDERSRRLLAAAESQAIGKGGISIVAKATGISRPVVMDRSGPRKGDENVIALRHLGREALQTSAYPSST